MQSEFKLAAYQYKLTTSTVGLSRPDSSTSGCATITQRTIRQSRHILKFRQFRPDGIRQRPKNFTQIVWMGIRVSCLLLRVLSCTYIWYSQMPCERTIWALA